ncbi:hypothetical protein BH10ACT8_BH10ACT8_31670 [soil metagenome]
MTKSPARPTRGAVRVKAVHVRVVLAVVALSILLVAALPRSGQALPADRTGAPPARATVPATVAATVLAAVPSTIPATIPAMTRQTLRYRAPVAGRLTVLVPFTAPASTYGPGHRGVDLAAGPGTSVLAAGPGIVRFAGSVAGRGVVVIAHRDGISTEYEPVTPRVREGQLVSLGQGIGTLAGAHRRCSPARCLHWGARRGRAYLDPLTLLQPLGVVRLLPWR